jgi:hypothetical protein
MRGRRGIPVKASGEIANAWYCYEILTNSGVLSAPTISNPVAPISTLNTWTKFYISKFLIELVHCFLEFSNNRFEYHTPPVSLEVV